MHFFVQLYLNKQRIIMQYHVIKKISFLKIIFTRLNRVCQAVELFKDVSSPHWRIQAITISLPNNRILLINSYFPTDPRINDFDTTDLLSTLNAIDNTFQNNEYDNIIWVGDINADFLRKTEFTHP